MDGGCVAVWRLLVSQPLSPVLMLYSASRACGSWVRRSSSAITCTASPTITTAPAARRASCSRLPCLFSLQWQSACPASTPVCRVSPYAVPMYHVCVLPIQRVSTWRVGRTALACESRLYGLPGGIESRSTRSITHRGNCFAFNLYWFTKSFNFRAW